MPTLPFAKTVIKVDVAVPAVVEAIVKRGVLTAVVAELEIERMEYGVVVPIPTLPLTVRFPPVVIFRSIVVEAMPERAKPVIARTTAIISVATRSGWRSGCVCDIDIGYEWQVIIKVP